MTAHRSVPGPTTPTRPACSRRPTPPARLTALAVVLLAACAPVAPVATPQPVGIPDQMPGPLPERPIEFPAFTEFTLANGLEVIHVPHHVQPVANLTLYLYAGGADDPAAQAGRTSMAAQLLRQGTTTRTAEEISEAIEGVGGSLGAGADADFLTVSSTVLADDLGLAFDLVADITRRPTFPADEVSLVVQRTLSGLRAQLGQPGEIARRRFVEAVYGQEHPYGRSPTPASVQAITRDDLVELHGRVFRPDAAVLVVAGDVDVTRARQLAERHFGDWQPGAGRRAAIPAPADPGPTRIALVHRPGSVQATLRIGHLGTRPDEPDYFALQVLNQVLGGGFTSRLMQRLRDELGWTYGAGSSFTQPREVGVFSATTEVRTEVADSAIMEILAQLRSLRQEPMDPEEMDAAVSYLVGRFPLSVQTAGQIAGQIARARLLGQPLEHITQYRERILQITPEDVTAAARRHVDPDRAVIVVVGDAAQLIPRLSAIAPVTLYDVEGAELDPAAVDAAAEPDPAAVKGG
jgi:zinc protease